MCLLVAGGEKDPNLAVLLDAAATLGIDTIDLRISATSSPAFSWDLDQDAASVDGAPVVPTAAFLRMDVFAPLDDPRPEPAARALGWYQTISGWLACRRVRAFNREMPGIACNKLAILRLAASVGLRIPKTLVTNDLPVLRETAAPRIAKPVAGGGYCHTLETAMSEAGEADRAPMPAIVQPRLAAPEIRIYIVGAEAFAFEMKSNSLDYRVLQDVQVSSIPPPAAETAALRRLMAALPMDFGAADFKTDPQDGSLVFLELNTSPMFARFDAAASGRLCQAMVRELVDCRAGPGITSD